MRLRKIGDYVFKGSVGIYCEAVDVPRTEPRYCAIDSGFLPDEQFPAIRRGAVFDPGISDHVISLFPRIDQCL